MKISVVTPIYNEAKNIDILLESLTKTLQGLSFDYEIIAVDDASRDGSWETLFAHRANKHLKLIRLAVHGGQTGALQAGIDHAHGDIIIPIDSDLENDPQDIPKLIKKIEEGYDVVSGWRKDRWKGGVSEFVQRKIPSMFANWCIAVVTGVKLHDSGCTLKAYKKEVLKPIDLYGEMHRFIPFFAKLHGAKITEMPVLYHKRRFGKSNYSISRTFRVILDLIVVAFFDKYFTRPMHFFGSIGFAALLLACVAFTWAGILKWYGTSLIQTPLPVLGSMFMVLAVLLFSMGVLSELLMRTYFTSRNERPYKVGTMINIS